MRRCVQILLASLLMATVAQAQDQVQRDSLGQPIDPAREYESCVRLAKTDPKAAFEAAQIWRAKGGGAPARHCGALALTAEGQFAAAALELEALADLVDAAGQPAPADVLAQAANAWLLAGNAGRARERIEEAVILRPDDVALIVDKVRILVSLKDFRTAETDIERALKLAPKSAPLHVYHASILRRLGRFEDAARAIGEAMALAGDSPAALLERGLVREQTGDPAGAKADWRALIEKYSGSIAAKAAAEHIDRLENPRPVRGRRRPDDGSGNVDQESNPESN